MTRFNETIRRLAPCLAVLSALSCATDLPLPPASENIPATGDYVIGVSDRLSINVWKMPELSLSVPVRNDGKVSVPLLDDVQAAGLTPEELKEVVSESLREFVTSPDVTVIVTEMNSKTASVIGEVARAGLVPLQRDTRVLDAIALMGGFTPYARSQAVRVLRRTPDGVVEYGFNYDAYVRGKAPGANFLIKPGDTIVVPD
ncbi:MAG: polysaccharide biosynthesis/export family protein [Myxococcota bacterium]